MSTLAKLEAALMALKALHPDADGALLDQIMRLEWALKEEQRQLLKKGSPDGR